MKTRFLLLAFAALALPIAGMAEEKQAPPAPAPATAPAYKMLATPKTPEEKAILGQLEKLKLTPKEIEKQPLSKALHLLNKQGAAGRGSAVMNYIVRGQTGDSPKVTLAEKETTFAAAIDDACNQAGLRWKIELAEDQKQAPVLVIFPKDEKE